MAQLLLPKGLTPESVAILEEVALERRRSAAKYSAAHDDELTATGWRMLIAARVANATTSFAGPPNIVCRQQMLESAAAIIAWIEAFDRSVS